MNHARFLPARRAVVLALGGGPLLGAAALARAVDAADAPSAARLMREAAPNPLYAQSFASLDQGEVTLRGFLGKPLVVNFWASWCPPCVKEMPDLQSLSQAHPAVGFVGLAVDTEANVRRFVRKTPVSYPILLGGHGGIQNMRDLGNRQGGLPFTVLFDAQGRAQRHVLGPIHVETLDGYLHALDA